MVRPHFGTSAQLRTQSCWLQKASMVEGQLITLSPSGEVRLASVTAVDVSPQESRQVAIHRRAMRMVLMYPSDGGRPVSVPGQEACGVPGITPEPRVGPGVGRRPGASLRFNHRIHLR